MRTPGRASQNSSFAREARVLGAARHAGGRARRLGSAPALVNSADALALPFLLLPLTAACADPPEGKRTGHSADRDQALAAHGYFHESASLLVLGSRLWNAATASEQGARELTR